MQFPDCDSRAEFHDTRPSFADAVESRKPETWRNVLERFFLTYWPPLYAYLRRKGCSKNDAMDILQDFFLEALETGKVLIGWKRARGRFRHWIIRCLENHRINAHDAEEARAEHGAASIWTDDDEAEIGRLEQVIADPRAKDPETLLEREWAKQAFERAREALAVRVAKKDEKNAVIVREYLTPDRRRGDGAALAKRLGLGKDEFDQRAHRLMGKLRTEFERQVEVESRTVEEAPGEARALIHRLTSEGDDEKGLITDEEVRRMEEMLKRKKEEKGE